MATLKELAEKHGFPFKIRARAWKSEYVEFFFTTTSEFVGRSERGGLVTLPIVDVDHLDDWKLYIEPKPQIRRWLWEWMSYEDDLWHIHTWASEKESENFTGARKAWRKSPLCPDGILEDE